MQNSFRFDEIFHQKKIMKMFVKVCLHSSHTLQNSFQFDEIFHKKIWRHLVIILGTIGTKVDLPL